MDNRAKKSFHLEQHFDWDVLLSHASLDNQPLEEYKGLVSYIEDFMHVSIGGGSSRKLRFFIDLKNLSNLNELSRAVKSSVIFVAFISDAYVNLKRQPNSCHKEVNEFYEHAPQHTIGKHIETGLRVFKILLHPVTLDEQNLKYFPKHFIDIIEKDYYKFYEYKDGNLNLLRHFSGKENKDKFHDKVGIIAGKISENLNLIEKQLASIYKSAGDSQSSDESVSRQEKATVYLAEATSDLQVQHFKLERELRKKGYTVLPESPLPTIVKSVQEEVESCLQEASLSIHLIGKEYGIIPKGSEKSLSVLQYELAKSHSEFPRLVWMAPGLDPEDSRQKELIQSLQGFSDDFDKNCDLNQTIFEDFKSFVYEKLEKLEKARQDETSQTKQINLLYHESDRNQIVQLKRYLSTFDNLKILESMMVSEKMQGQHERNLKLCDAVLIYWGNSSKRKWLKLVARGVIGNTNSGTNVLQAIYLEEPLSSEKLEIESDQLWGFDIIKGLYVLDQFLKRLSGE